MLVSGVSGGGVAVAYFAAHEDELLKDTESGRTWNQFACAMSYPFIWDVLEGASERRILTGTRLGQLLAESFCRVFTHRRSDDGGMQEAEDQACPGVRNIGDVKNFGIIFNTTLSGSLKCLQCKDEPDFAAAAAEEHDLTDGSVAGGRLIFTNLKDSGAFSSENSSVNIPSKDNSENATQEANLDAYAVRQIINDLHQPGKDEAVMLCEGESINRLWYKLVVAKEREQYLPLIDTHLKSYEKKHLQAWQALRDTWTKDPDEQEKAGATKLIPWTCEH